jgi:hypothetical protein
MPIPLFSPSSYLIVLNFNCSALIIYNLNLHLVMAVSDENSLVSEDHNVIRPHIHYYHGQNEHRFRGAYFVPVTKDSCPFSLSVPLFHFLEPE